MTDTRCKRCGSKQLGTLGYCSWCGYDNYGIES